jgi:hypothetical protein
MKFHMPLFDAGDYHRIPLDEEGQNYVDVTAVKTEQAHATYLQGILGGRQPVNRTFEVDSAVSDMATLSGRIIGWKISHVRQDGTEVQLPFSREAIAKLSHEVVEYLVAEIKKLDSGFESTETGTADPLG